MSCYHYIIPYFCRRIEYVPYKLPMKIIGGALILVGIAEFGVGLSIFTYFKNSSYGAWWGAILVMVSGVIAFTSPNKDMVVGGLMVSSLAFLIVLIGTVMDGAAWKIFSYIRGCYNSDTQVGYGSPSSITEAKACSNGAQCTCMASTFCYEFELAGGSQDCGNIMTTYTTHLHASLALLSLSTLLVLIYAVTTCVSICSKDDGVRATPEEDETLIRNPINGHGTDNGHHQHQHDRTDSGTLSSGHRALRGDDQDDTEESGGLEMTNPQRWTADL